jgi:citrate synthase
VRTQVFTNITNISNEVKEVPLSKVSDNYNDILNLTELCIKNSNIDPTLYEKYEVKRGLRDITGKGVLAGLTEIGEVKAYTIEDSELVPCEGKLFYRELILNK